MQITPDVRLNMLRDARALIVKGWTQGEYARNAEGLDVTPSSDEAVCFCALGAWHAAADEQGFDLSVTKRANKIQKLEDELSRLFSMTDIPNWNDKPGRTKEQVLAQFDAAISASMPAG